MAVDRATIQTIIDARYDGVVSKENVADAERRYLGQFATVRALAKHLAVQAYPPAAEVGVLGVDFDSWPFNHINWEDASFELDFSVLHGTLAETPGGHWFDFAD